MGGSPAITSADSDSFTIGSPGSFTVATTGNPAPDISRSGALPAGVSFTSNGDGTATIAGTPGPGTSGTYPLTLKARNGVPPDAVQQFTLTVKGLAPEITSQPADQAVTTGETATFTAAASGDPTPDVQWQSSAGGAPYTDIAGATSGTLTLDAVTAAA